MASGVLFQIQDDKLDGEKNLFTKEDIAGYTKAARESLNRLTIPNGKKQTLENLLEFVMKRNI